MRVTEPLHWWGASSAGTARLGDDSASPRPITGPHLYRPLLFIASNFPACDRRKKKCLKNLTSFSAGSMKCVDVGLSPTKTKRTGRRADAFECVPESLSFLRRVRA